MGSIAERLKVVRDNIVAACRRVDRDPKGVKLIIVTKTATLPQIQEVIRLGYRDFGENRVQHLKQVSEEIAAWMDQEKIDPESDPVCWHMIGHLQRNKVKQVLKHTVIIHSVDTLRLAEELNTQASKAGLKVRIFLQINCSEEPQKYGVPVGAANHLAEQFVTMPNLQLVGLMTMAPLTRDKEVVRACFIRAREIYEEIRKEGIAPRNEFIHLNMGMSQDYEIAVEEGATILRVGSAIFTPSF